LPNTPTTKETSTSTLLIHAIEQLMTAAEQQTAAISKQSDILEIMKHQNKRIIELMETEDKGTKRVRYNKFAREEDNDDLNL
jgi:hypothetical protein